MADRIVPVALRTGGGPLFVAMISFVVLAGAAWMAARTYWPVASRIDAHGVTKGCPRRLASTHRLRHVANKPRSGRRLCGARVPSATAAASSESTANTARPLE